MMPQPPTPESPSNEFLHSLDALIHDDMSDVDHAHLNQTLRDDPDARRTYIRNIIFEAMLAREFAPAEKFESAPSTPATRKIRWAALATIAATIIIAATLAWLAQPPPQTPIEVSLDPSENDEPITHAVITSLDDVSGRFGNFALTQGQRLSDGLLELDHGTAQITFDSGAEVTLEGPAQWHLESDRRSLLTRGRATARVPEQAGAFVIHTPSSSIRNLGKAFAVEVRNNQETDLHALDGDVEIADSNQPATSPPKIIHQREAVRVGAGNMRAINFKADDRPRRHAHRATSPPAAVHWSFDTWDHTTTTDPLSGLTLKLQQNKKKIQPTTVDGRFGLALHLDGQATFARSNSLAIDAAHARTVACWLRLPTTTLTTDHTPDGIISWGVNGTHAKWQLTTNNSEAQGTTGALRVEFGDGFITASTDLRDGRWHHIAVVYLGGPKANLASHVRIYIDGRLDPLSGRRPQRIIGNDHTRPARPLIIGRLMQHKPGRQPHFLNGDLDELHLIDAPLLPAEIIQLMQDNTLLSDTL